MVFLLVFLAGLWAGLQNALAGGGSFITLPALILSGLSPLAANITSTVALFPAQIASGVAGRQLVSGVGSLSFRGLFVISILGGALGAMALHRVNERLLRIAVVGIGVALTIGLFVRPI